MWALERREHGDEVLVTFSFIVGIRKMTHNISPTNIGFKLRLTIRVGWVNDTTGKDLKRACDLIGKYMTQTSHWYEG